MSTVTLTKKHLCLILATLGFITVAVYWPVLTHEFISYDDPVYVVENKNIWQGFSRQGLVWAFTSLHGGNWHPLTWLSHMMDVQFFAFNPAGHHLTSLLLHSLNAVILANLLRRLTGDLWPSVMVALLFALHPLHVESVVWVAERKDLLSTLFWLLTLQFYQSYVRRPCAGSYVLVLITFAMGLMSKPMLVTLPILLLMLDYWPLCRFSPRSGQNAALPSLSGAWLLKEKLPFFLLSMASGVITIIAQKAWGAVDDQGYTSILQNVGNALIAYSAYLIKMIYPLGLAPIYPFDATSITPWKVTAAGIALLAASVVVVRVRRRYPFLTVGWFWYLVTLLPVIGLMQVGAQAMADRYTYVPLIGIFMMVCWGGAELLSRWRRGTLVGVGWGIVVMLVLAILTRQQLAHWKNSIALYTHTLSVTRNNWVIHNNLGVELLRTRAIEEAIPHYLESIRINPAWPDSRNNLGVAYTKVGEYEKAVKSLEGAVLIKPRYTEAQYNLGYAYLKNGQLVNARRVYQRLRELDERFADALLGSIRLYDR